MCKSHAEGYKRCNSSATSRASESLRKSINFQAKKEGLSAADWKEKNPEKLALINSTYDERLKRFAAKIGGIHDVLNNIPESLNVDYGFVSKGNKREPNSREYILEYRQKTREYIERIGLTRDERHSIICASSYKGNAMNSYIKHGRAQEVIGVIKGNTPPWRESTGKELAFSDKEDILDFAEHLDSALKHRVEEPRTVYSGLNILAVNSIVTANNNGQKSYELDTIRSVLAKTYEPGSSVTFDEYSFASDKASTAASSSNADYPYRDTPPAGIIFEIKSNAGVPISSFVENGQARGIMMPRGMNFKVVNSYWNENTEEGSYKYENIEENEVKHNKEGSATNPNDRGEEANTN